MRRLGYRGSLDHTKRVPVTTITNIATTALATVLSVTGAGFLEQLTINSNYTGNSNAYVKLTVDGVASDEILFFKTLNNSSGANRAGTGFFNIPIRFESSLLIEAKTSAGSVNVQATHSLD